MNPRPQQRAFFNTGNTKQVSFRIEQLKRLKQGILKHQDAIVKAAKADLGRPEFEAYFEIGVLGELNRALKQLKSWVKPKQVATSLDQFPATAWIVPEPLGIVLIIGPWNYPFQLMFSPLIGAIAAGNCALLKPSELAPHTSQVVAQLIQDTFEPAYIAVVEGGVETSQQLLAEKFDYIFFTGGTRVGKIVMEAAAKNITPVTLELGGKNPCIVDTDVRLDYTAKRIAWGKFINAGQTCAAPDYLLVDQRIKSDLLKNLQHSIDEFFGDNPVKSPDYARIINEKHFSRLLPFLENGKVIVGGEAIKEKRYIAPTILDQVRWDDPVMQEEIFGPILPVLVYDNLEEAIAKINARPKPLALYFFSRNQQKQAKVLQSTSSGGVCLNDTVMQYATWGLPFGGVGESGIGAYHGKSSFDTFSHYKSVLKKSFWLDLSWRYAPYKGKLGFLKKVITGS
ncbi:MAG: aldehyde dehydrogenase [Symploca sp. SIO2E9]|nr:aldehyde dehydrogenase [Symploca sp. SIO2E9]